MVSFPALVAFGEPEIVSNATNTGAMWPAAVSSAFGYLKDTRLQRGLLLPLLVPSLLGGLLGAVILVVTPAQAFETIVPFLVLFATLLFAFRNPITRRFARGNPSEGRVSTREGVGFLFQLFVATYGGYFGAGIGVLMLGSLSIMGMRNIHEMNTVKTTLGAAINVVAFIFFAFRGLVVWTLLLLMIVGSIIGGYGGARLAKRINPRIIHLTIVAIGLVVSAWFFARIF